MTAATTTAVLHQAGTGPGTWSMNSLFEHLVGAAATGGRLGMSLVTQPPGIATPLHRHTREAEALFVLDGHIDYRAGDELVSLAEGSFLYLPQGCRTRSASAARHRPASSRSRPRAA